MNKGLLLFSYHLGARLNKDDANICYLVKRKNGPGVNWCHGAIFWYGFNY